MKKGVFLTLLLLTALTARGLFAQEHDYDWHDTVYALQQSFRDISARVLPVVVEINVVENIKQQIPSFSPWQFFFDTPHDSPSLTAPRQREFTKKGLGSGVIIAQKADTVYVITNYHVAGDADEITISLFDGRQYRAELAGADPDRDLALISFQSDENLPTAILGDSDALRTGDWVLAVGNPYGFESTVTQGIISATGRTDMNGGIFDYLQTDAAINSGNSGGALVNLRGEVIGINTWIATKTGGSVGLGFAIPVNRIRESMEELISQGKVEYGWLGVNMGTATESLKAQMDLHEWEGAFIFSVYSHSPAWAEGLRPGDLIIAVDGEPVPDSRGLAKLISERKPGEKIKITFVRQDRELTKSIILSSRGELVLSRNENHLWPGFTVAEVNENMRARLGLSRNTAADLIIGNVFEESQASEEGLQNGDIIKTINNGQIRSVQDFYQLLEEEEELYIRIERRGYEFEYRLVLQ